MADHADENVNAAVNSVVENASKLPGNQTSQVSRTSPRLFNSDKTVHQMLGGGQQAPLVVLCLLAHAAADVMLWRNKPLSGGVLAGATIAWVLFEWSGYTLLSLLANVLLFLVVILFLWSNAATLLNRSPPPLPELILPEHAVMNTAATLRVELNKILLICHDVALGRDFKLFLKVIGGLWILSIIGGWFNFLTLLYIGVVIAHTFPVLYEKYEEEINKYAKVASDHANVQYKKFDANVLSKIPRALPKDKKAQ